MYNPNAQLVEPGLGFGVALGKSTFRSCLLQDGNIVDGTLEIEPLPPTPYELGHRLGKAVINAAEADATWIGFGFPCPVNRASGTVGSDSCVEPFGQERSLKQWITAAAYLSSATHAKAVSKAARHITQCEPLIANDCDLLSHAAALPVKESASTGPPSKRSSIAAITIGTGLGAGLVERTTSDPVYRLSGMFNEPGIYIPEVRESLGLVQDILADQLAGNSLTLEEIASGPGIKAATGAAAEDLDSDHPYWQKVAAAVGYTVVMLQAVYGGIDRIMISGGVGTNRANAYGPHLDTLLGQLKDSKIRTDLRVPPTLHVPAVVYAKPDDADRLELLGLIGLQAETLNPPPHPSLDR